LKSIREEAERKEKENTNAKKRKRKEGVSASNSTNNATKNAQMSAVLLENQALRSALVSLKERLLNAETEIREEVAEEFEDRISEIHRDYKNSTMVAMPDLNSSFENCKHKTAPTPGRSLKKIKSDIANEYIDELLEKIEECEEEMTRMAEDHFREVERLRQDLELRNAEVGELRTEVMYQKEEIAKLRGDVVIMKDGESDQSDGEESVMDLISEIDENEQAREHNKDQTKDQIKDQIKDEPDSASNKKPRKLRRIRRERVSEVACMPVNSLVKVKQETFAGNGEEGGAGELQKEESSATKILGKLSRTLKRKNYNNNGGNSISVKVPDENDANGTEDRFSKKSRTSTVEEEDVFAFRSPLSPIKNKTRNSSVDGRMDNAYLAALSRSELQQLAKGHGIKANQKSSALISALSGLAK